MTVLTQEDVRERLAAAPASMQPLMRHTMRELGVLVEPELIRVRRALVVLGVPPTMNENEVRSHWKGFAAAKKLWQGELMREFHRAGLPRPIPSVGPLWLHAELRFPKPLDQETENRRGVLAKAAGDALVGPLWEWENVGRKRKMVAAHRAMIVDGVRYVGGWLDDDKDRHWLLTMGLDPEPGRERTVLRFSWDERRQTAGADFSTSSSTSSNVPSFG